MKQTQTLDLGQLTLRGTSIGGRHTVFLIKELRLAFDMGAIIDGIERVNTVLISHGHCDHIGALPPFTCIHKTKSLGTALYVMPEICIQPFLTLVSCQASLDEGSGKVVHPSADIDIHSAELLSRGECFTIGSNRCVASCPMVHRVPSYAYIVLEKRTKLKDQYIGQDIKQLRKMDPNLQVSETVSTPIIAYTGDTTFEGLLNNPQLFETQVLIMECSFILAEDRDVAKHGQHVHLDDVVDNVHLFKNHILVLTHFSNRYDPCQIKDTLTRRLRPVLDVGIKLVAHCGTTFYSIHGQDAAADN